MMASHQHKIHRFLSSPRRLSSSSRPPSATTSINIPSTNHRPFHEYANATTRKNIHAISFPRPSAPMTDMRHTRWNLSTTPTTTNSSFSTAAAPPSRDEGRTSPHSKKHKKEDSNLFLDNLGKIFLSTIALVLLSLLRSTKGNNAKASLREDVEASALLDPLEIDDLRFANEQLLTKSVWDEILKEFREVGKGSVTYGTFMNVVLRVLRRIHGEGATIQCGHLMDRVVIAEMDRVERERNASETSGESDGSVAPELELPLSFLLAALSLALCSTVADRIGALYNVMVLMQEFKDDDGQQMTAKSHSDSESQTLKNEQLSVSLDRVEQMIQHLQYTCQLVPAAQIVETNSNIPYQRYRVADGTELTIRAREEMGGKKKNDKGGEGEGSTSDAVGLEDFYAILKSKSVCAWGECYVKKSDRMATSD